MSDNDWDYNQRYNAAGEWNPRLTACADCGEYHEPDQLNYEDKCPLCRNMTDRRKRK